MAIDSHAPRVLIENTTHAEPENLVFEHWRVTSISPRLISKVYCFNTNNVSVFYSKEYFCVIKQHKMWTMARGKKIEGLIE